MTIIFYLLSALMVVPAVIYFYFFFRRFLTLFGLEKGTGKSRGLAFILAMGIGALGIRLFDFPFLIMIHLFMTCVAMDLLNLVLRRIRAEEFQKKWSVLYRSGIVCVIVTASVLVWGYYNMHHIQRTVYDVNGGLSEPVKVVQVTDLHMGTVFGEEELQEICGRIQKEDPDILALTGDIFDESTSEEQMRSAVGMLAEIETTFGTYYVFGNHDVNQYAVKPAYTTELLRETLTDAGISVLEDETVEITPELSLIGRLDASEDDRSPLASLTASAKGDFILLLDHQPKELDENAATGVDLQLSGHTHGGQIWPMGFLSKLAGVNEEYYGFHQIGNYRVIVSSGLAGWGYPVRTECPSEYVVVNIE